MWYKELGPEQDVVFSTRIRLARNIEGVPFYPRMNAEQAESLWQKVVAASERMGGYLTAQKLSELNAVAKQSMVEEHLLSRELLQKELPCGVLLSGDRRVSVMVNEEDHLRIQAVVAGFDPAGALDLANRVDDALEESLPYAFDAEWGYLTTCPTNMGTGLRVSVMVHLPGLTRMRQMQSLIQALSKIGLTVRGLYGEGTEASGAVYQISNQITLGVSEAEILEKVTAAINQVIKMERTAVRELKEAYADALSDEVWRAYGVLKYARKLSTEEFMKLYSQVRFGMVLGMLPIADTAELRALFVAAQPANIVRGCGRELTPAERDTARAEVVREALKGEL